MIYQYSAFVETYNQWWDDIDESKLYNDERGLESPGNAPDIESAKRWLNMAASQGDEESKNLLKTIDVNQ
ncbi:MAG: hypothetical protein NC453_21295 [Muribaculum sp.]|nr:hypothetical protein [Muribaculum sp.]